MPWVRFTEPFDWKPSPAVTIAYSPGHVGNVTRGCAAAAKAAGKAVAAKNPRSANNGGRKDAGEACIPEAQT